MEVHVIERTEQTVDLLHLLQQLCPSDELAEEAYVRALKRFGMEYGDGFSPADAIVELEFFLGTNPRTQEAIDAVVAIMKDPAKKRSREDEEHALRVIEVLTPVCVAFDRGDPVVARHAREIIKKKLKELD